MPGISHVTRGKRINLVGTARERHFSPGYDLFIPYYFLWVTFLMSIRRTLF